MASLSLAIVNTMTNRSRALLTTIASTTNPTFSNGFAFPHITDNGRVTFSGYGGTSSEEIASYSLSSGRLSSLVKATSGAKHGYTSFGAPSSAGSHTAFLGLSAAATGIYVYTEGAATPLKTVAENGKAGLADLDVSCSEPEHMRPIQLASPRALSRLCSPHCGLDSPASPQCRCSSAPIPSPSYLPQFPSVDAAGHVAFQATRAGVAGIFAAVWQASSPGGPIVQVYNASQSLPGSHGEKMVCLSNPSINNAVVAFFGSSCNGASSSPNMALREREKMYRTRRVSEHALHDEAANLDAGIFLAGMQSVALRCPALRCRTLPGPA
jgi:hypothetical protein